ncbi:MAG: hypothetical protein D6799_00385 [Bacteroidetes bacterium]|nr:MAG: hypothetical protein D6799_00385 [Bacteroidota bacterium]
MPHFSLHLNVGIAILLDFVFCNYFTPQNSISSEKKNLYLPLIDTKNKLECSVIEHSSKTYTLQFLEHPPHIYLKVIFSYQKDTLTGPPLKKYRSELEIQSGNKSYYKKEWDIYQEGNQLFFVLLLPSNYLKTLSTEGITEIIIGNSATISLSKKETQNIKQIANYLLNQ